MEEHPITTIQIKFFDMEENCVYRSIKYEDDMWCIFDNYSDKIFESEDIKCCIESTYTDMKCHHEGEIFLSVYTDRNLPGSEIRINLGEDETVMADKMKDILFEFVDDWNT